MEDQINVSETGGLKDLKYKQELKRSIGFFGAFAVAFSAISVTTGVFLNYGTMMTTIGPLGLWTFPLVGIGSTLIALIFCEMASLMPVTGQCYLWVSNFFGKGLGWFVGWVTFCYLVVITPSVCSPLGSIIGPLLGIEVTPRFTTIVAVTALTLQLLISVFSVKLTSVISSASAITESVGIILLAVALGFAAFRSGAPVSNVVAVNPSLSGNSIFVPFLMSSLMGFYTLVAFESAANMSDETRNAAKNVPKAMTAAIGLSTLTGTLLLIAAALNIKDINAVIKSDSPFAFIIQSSLGTVVGKLFLIVAAVSVFACGLAFITSSSRTIYAMSRDNAFFASGVFKKVDKKTGTPIMASILIWACSVGFTVFSTPTVLAIASAALPCVYYLITLISYAVVRKNIKFNKNNFNLGKFAIPLLVITIVWEIIALGILSIPSDFRGATVVNICLVTIGGILYFAYFKKKINEEKEESEEDKQKAEVI